jgi:hypothetical protein
VPYNGKDDDCNAATREDDLDSDGYRAEATGGHDCDDTNPAINPGATDIPYDGIDQSCSGSDLRDVDRDGYEGSAVGGDDCNDTNAAVHPTATEIPYDGIDQDCSGADLVDADGDGANGPDFDCDDEDPARYPAATEIPEDGIDQDCNGADFIPLDVVDNGGLIEVTTSSSGAFLAYQNDSSGDLHGQCLNGAGVPIGSGFDFPRSDGEIASELRLAHHRSTGQILVAESINRHPGNWGTDVRILSSCAGPMTASEPVILTSVDGVISSTESFGAVGTDSGFLVVLPRSGAGGTVELVVIEMTSAGVVGTPQVITSDATSSIAARIAVNCSSGSCAGLVAWIDGSDEIQVRRLNGHGVPSGSSRHLADSSSDEVLGLSALGTGYLITYSMRPTPATIELVGQRLAADGSTIGAVFNISEDSAWPRDALVTFEEGTSAWVLWQGLLTDYAGSNSSVFAQRIDSSGALVGELVVVGSTYGDFRSSSLRSAVFAGTGRVAVFDQTLGAGSGVLYRATF